MPNNKKSGDEEEEEEEEEEGKDDVAMETTAEGNPNRASDWANPVWCALYGNFLLAPQSSESGKDGTEEKEEAAEKEGKDKEEKEGEGERGIKRRRDDAEGKEKGERKVGVLENCWTENRGCAV